MLSVGCFSRASTLSQCLTVDCLENGQGDGKVMGLQAQCLQQVLSVGHCDVKCGVFQSSIGIEPVSNFRSEDDDIHAGHFSKHAHLCEKLSAERERVCVCV